MPKVAGDENVIVRLKGGKLSLGETKEKW